MAEESIMRIEHVSKSFVGVKALVDVTISVPKGSIWGLIGPNGAGKSTLLNVINRILDADSGHIYFGSHRLNDYPVFDVAKLGISRTFQVPRVFRRMSVFDNMLVPTILVDESVSRQSRRIMELLEFVGIHEKKDQYAQELSGGQQKLLEFARALVTDPDLILMDEPFAGVHPEIRKLMIGNIKMMNAQGKSFILVSHDMRSITDLCEQVTVMTFGQKLTEGPTGEVLTDERVIEAYLGD